MKISIVFSLSLCLCALTMSVQADESLNINQLQFVGSHNSYKLAMSPQYAAQLKQRNPQAAAALDYAHIPLAEQLDLGLRKLELDVFYDPQTQRLPVGHVQVIDMNSHCADLRACLSQAVTWSQAHPTHVPIWISFNAKDGKVEGLPDPAEFDLAAFDLFDRVITEVLKDRLITPAQVRVPHWPSLQSARGKFLLILDEQGAKRDLYARTWRQRPMFVNAPEGHPAAAVMIVNDPVGEQQNIRRLVNAGYMVRTRADADTVEARSGDTSRREAAFASGAQAISTDYYLPAERFGTGYQVKIPGGIRCNPLLTGLNCVVEAPW